MEITYQKVSVKENPKEEGTYDTNIGECKYTNEKGYGWHRSGVEYYFIEELPSQEIAELPTNEEIEIYCRKYISSFPELGIKIANWMKQLASKIISRKDEQIVEVINKYSKSVIELTEIINNKDTVLSQKDDDINKIKTELTEWKTAHAKAVEELGEMRNIRNGLRIQVKELELKSSQTIELPSDEKIKQEAHEWNLDGVLLDGRNEFSFIEGVKWLRSQLTTKK